jgi:hypothetical protein
MTAILRSPPAGRRSLSGVSHFASLKSSLSQRCEAQLHSSSIYSITHEMPNPGPMPPPTSPASASASRALVRHTLSCPSTPLPRSRALSIGGQSAVTPSAAAQSGRFSETTMSQVKAIYGGSKRCWVCRGGMADCAHVFPKEDDQVCHSHVVFVQ